MAKNKALLPLFISIIVIIIVLGIYLYSPAPETTTGPTTDIPKPIPEASSIEPGESVPETTTPDITEPIPEAPTTEPTTPEDAVEEPETTVGDDEVIVTIRLTRLDPVEVTIKPGTTVTWVNEDPGIQMLHHIAVNRLFTSDRIPPGGTFSYTFEEPGIHKYGGVIHPGMIGKVIVESDNPITGSAIGLFSNSSLSGLFTLAVIMFILAFAYLLHRRTEIKP